MCGFVGFINNLNTKNLSKSVILNMNQALYHRGPDDQSYLETEKL